MSTKEKKARNFCFTLYNINEQESDNLEKLVNDGFCKTLFYTHELGELKDNPHIQGFLSCDNMNRLLNVKSKINSLFKDKDPNPHIEIAKGTAYQNYVYITKELKDNPNLKHVIFGNIPLPPGKKRDDNKFESYVDLLENGEITLKQIEEQDLAHFIRHEAHYLAVRSKLVRRGVRPPTFVAWFSGTTGTGKTYTAKEIAKRLGFEVYEAGCDNGFFNAYNGEECSIWDDYRSGPITFSSLLKITDRDGTMINIKGGKVFFAPKIQIFTSPEGIESAKTHEMKSGFTTLDNKFEQLKRRVSYTANFQNSKLNTIPVFSEVKRASLIIQNNFLSVYKQFLIEEGFESFIPLINGLDKVVPKKVKRLINKDENCKISVNDNIL